MKTLHSKHLITGFVVLGLLIAAIELLYPVRELVAAWVIFSILFAASATALLILVLVEEAILKGMTLIEGHLIRVRRRNTAALLVLHHSDHGEEATVRSNG